MTDTITYDEEPARRIQLLSETADLRAQRQLVIELLAPQPGWRVLDVGCGPGHLTRELAKAVGPAGRVYGADKASTCCRSHSIKGWNSCT